MIRPARLLLAFILILAAFLRFYELEHSSLWSDEGNTWALLNRSFAQIARDAAADIHPPGYYWLLKLWTGVWGTSAAGMRSFSALLGVVLVFVVYQIGLQLEKRPTPVSWPYLALSAALVAAVNPLQIYYSQEARMYLLLTLVSAGLFWALLEIWTRINTDERGFSPGQRSRFPLPLRPVMIYLICAITGLWTHYSFPIILTAACLTYFIWLLTARNTRHSQSSMHSITSSSCHPVTLSPLHYLLTFATLNALTLLTYLPWLPTALERLRNWPKGGEVVPLRQGVALILQTLLFGPLRTLPEPLWPWLLVAGLLPLLGIGALRRHWGVLGLLFWLLAPVGLMAGLGLFSDAFLKFLLVASPAWSLLLAAAAVKTTRWPAAGVGLLALGAFALAGMTLPNYYADPTVRDNYAGVAQYLRAVADPMHDLVILDAPGQQEVWRYYDPGLPVLALPPQRPPDPTATTAKLAAAVADRTHIYTLFWATNEADPERLVETWLDRNSFKGLDSWQGNLRFVIYTLPANLTCAPPNAPVLLDEEIVLLAQCQPAFPQRVTAGEVALVGLQWQTQQPLQQRYKVTVQLLDVRNQVIAQRDSEPAGGSLPTDRWKPGETVIDNHGILISPGTPPGTYRLITAIYDPATGQRLKNSMGDAIPLGEVQVERSAKTLPVALLPIQHRLQRQLGAVRLLGYNGYRKEMAYAPMTPVEPGDHVEFIFYWQAPDPLPAPWRANMQFTLQLGGQSLTAPLAGGAYPTSAWQAGEVVQGKFELQFDGSERRATVGIGDQEVRLQPLPE